MSQIFDDNSELDETRAKWTKNGLERWFFFLFQRTCSLDCCNFSFEIREPWILKKCICSVLCWKCSTQGRLGPGKSCMYFDLVMFFSWSQICPKTMPYFGFIGEVEGFLVKNEVLHKIFHIFTLSDKKNKSRNIYWNFSSFIVFGNTSKIMLKFSVKG